MGHSFGGRTAVRATRKDKRVKCGINLDGGVQEDDADNPSSTPFMFMIAEKGVLCKKDLPGLEVISRLANTPGTNMKIVTIKEIGHIVFSDTPLLLNAMLFTRLLSHYINFGLELPADKASDILVNTVTPCIINFFEKHLKDK